MQKQKFRYFCYIGCGLDEKTQPGIVRLWQAAGDIEQRWEKNNNTRSAWRRKAQGNDQEKVSTGHMQTVEGNKQDDLICGGTGNKKRKKNENCSNALKPLIQRFQDVFQKPDTLPIAKEHDHSIPVIPGTLPVNIKPYQYLCFQKTEIERQVAKMLDSSIIQPSHRPLLLPCSW